jgi:hypothetical protein
MDDKGRDREALLRITVNLIVMLGHLNEDIMAMRQEAIKPALRPEFQKICNANIRQTLNSFLATIWRNWFAIPKRRTRLPIP